MFETRPESSSLFLAIRAVAKSVQQANADVKTFAY